MTINIDTTSIPESRDRYFWAQVDNKPVLFILHPDRGVCIASIQPDIVESIAEVLAELRGLAA